MAVSPLTSLPDQLVRIRAELEKYGTATISADEMDALCPDDPFMTDEFAHAAELAQAEGWDLDFATAGVVRVISPIESTYRRLLID